MPSFPPLVGFGFCPGPERDAPSRLTYRGVPPTLADVAASGVAGALNGAAARGVLDPGARFEPFEVQPAAQLSPEGWSLWRRLEVYGVLEVLGQERFEWTSYWGGEPCLTFAEALIPRLLDVVLRSAPQHLWAQRHFGEFARQIHGLGDPESAVMGMVEHDGLLRAAPEELVRAPQGLWKVVWAPMNPTLEGLVPRGEGSDQIRRVEGSRVRVGGGRFEVERLELARWELPAIVVPSVLESLEAQGVPLDDPAAPVSVVPCLDSDTPLVTLGGGLGVDATVWAPNPPAHWSPERREELVEFLRDRG